MNLNASVEHAQNLCGGAGNFFVLILLAVAALSWFAPATLKKAVEKLKQLWNANVKPHLNNGESPETDVPSSITAYATQIEEACQGADGKFCFEQVRSGNSIHQAQTNWIGELTRRLEIATMKEVVIKKPENKEIVTP